MPFLLFTLISNFCNLNYTKMLYLFQDIFVIFSIVLHFIIAKAYYKRNPAIQDSLHFYYLISHALTFLLHPLNHFKPCKFLSFLLFQLIRNLINQSSISWNRNIFKSICPLLCLLNTRCQPISCIFHHRKLDRQILHLPKRFSCNIN